MRALSLAKQTDSFSKQSPHIRTRTSIIKHRPSEPRSYSSSNKTRLRRIYLSLPWAHGPVRLKSFNSHLSFETHLADQAAPWFRDAMIFKEDISHQLDAISGAKAHSIVFQGNQPTEPHAFFLAYKSKEGDCLDPEIYPRPSRSVRRCLPASPTNDLSI